MNTERAWRMGLFHRIRKKVSEEDEVRDNVDTDSEIILRDDNHKEYIKNACESISKAKASIEAAKEEYSEVNSYLNDAEMIEELPPDIEAELKDTADHVMSLKSDLDSLDKKKANITQFQFQSLARFEDQIPKEIKKMKNDESYLELIKGDLVKLSDEHDNLVKEANEENSKRRFLGKFSIIASILIVLLYILYIAVHLLVDADMTNAFIFTTGGAVLIAAYLYFEAERCKKAITLNRAKMNRLISLTNTVKVKYVNETNSVDFARDKFNVHSAGELEYLWGQYVQMKDDEGKKKKTSATYDHFSNKLIEILANAKLHDPEIWVYQAEAIINHNEMVEIRHRLNVRRQKIRENIESNTMLIENETNKIHKFRSDYPDEKGLVNAMMDTYRILV